MLPMEMKGHTIIKVHSMETMCSPNDSYMMTENYDICINMAPEVKGPDMICRNECHLASGQFFIFLVVAKKEIQICEREFR